jgi:hypothetical protein
MLRAFRFFCGGVSGRILGIASLAVILFVTGCTTSGNSEAQLAVATLSGGLPAGSVSVGGGAYPSTALSASGGTAPYTWAVTMGTLPAGLALSSSGMLSGTPTTAGAFSFTVTVTDAATPTHHTAAASFTITVNPQLAITTTGTLTSTGEAGSVYPTTALSETGGVGPFNWTIISGLPGGLTLSSTGSISGTISASAAPGNFNFTAKVTDSQGNVVTSGTITLKVDPALMITPPTFPTGVVGVSYPAETFTATGGSGTGYTFALASGTLTSPLTVGANGTIASGMPTTAGTSTFTVKVTDSLGYSATTSSLSITVNGALAITPPTFPTGIVSASYPAETFTASGGSGSGYSFTLASGSLPTPLTLGANGTIASGTPTTAGTYTFTVKVTDSLGDTATSNSLSITIDPVLVITPPTLPAGVVGAAYPAKTFTAAGGSGTGYMFTLASGSLPTPLTLGANGTIASATPTNAGTYTFTVKVTDSLGFTNTSGSLSITIDPALMITPPTFPTGVVGVSYPSETFTANGGSGAGYTFTLASGSLPGPLTLGANGTISSAMPTTAGIYTFTVKVTDSLGFTTTTGSLSITINGPLAITPPTFPIGIVNASYPSETFTAGGGSGTGYTFTLASGSLPTPLSLGSNGTIPSGTPTTAGTSTFTVKVTDSLGNTATSTSLSIIIDPALVITPPTFPTGIINTSYPSETFTATGGSGSGYTFTLASGSLPTPLALGANGTIASATPTVSGTFNFTVKVTDSQGFTTTTGTLSITINAALGITPPSFPSGVVGVSYPAETFTATGGSGAGYAFTLASGSLPSPLILGANGTIASAMPTTAGTYTFTVKVTDSLGNTATTGSLSITINLSLAITPPSFPTGVVGGIYPSETFTASGGSGAGYTFTLASGSLPSPLTLGTNGTIASGTPNVGGTFNFTVKVTDSLGNTATTSGLSIIVDSALVITPPTFPIGIINTSYPAETFTASGGSGTGYTFALASGSLPTPLNLGTNGTIASGTPMIAGTYTFTVKVTDSLGFTTTTGNLSITINGVLAITPPTFPAGFVGSSYPAETFTASGGSGSGYTFTLATGSLPNPLTLGTNGTIASAVPTAAGVYTFTVKVTDSLGNTATTSTLNISITMPSCTSNCTISGTVTGPWVSGVTISRSGSATTTTTDSSGKYSFTGLAGGTYTITPSLAGYTFSPANPSVATSSNTTPQDFTEIPVVASYTISGTVGYTGSHTTGNTIIRVYQSGGCSGNCNLKAQTGFIGVPSSGGTQYTVRGLQPTGTNPGQPASYIVTAEIDTLGNGYQNLSNPVGSISGVTLPSANAVNVNFSVSDPLTAPTPTAPCSTSGNALSIAPQSGFAVAQCKIPQDVNGVEIAESYKIYAATDTAFTQNLVTQTYPAHGTHDNVFIMGNLTNGLAYYFKMTALVPAHTPPESGPSNIFGPVTIGPSSTGSTVSGTVTFPGTVPSGVPLYAGVYGNNGIYAVRILSPVTGLTYTIPGVANGTYQNFAIIDMNKNGIIDVGDITDVSGNSNPPTITVTAPGPTTGNIVLANPTTTLKVSTSHQQYSPSIGNPDNYNVNFGVTWGSKRPIAITLFSGPNVSVPFDLVTDQNNNGGQSPAFLQVAVPAVGDTYHFQVTFSDGTTTPDMTASITAVLNSFAQNLAMNTPVNSTSTSFPPANDPMLNWSAPATLPTALPYTYSVGIYSVNGSANVNWNYYGGNNSNGIASTTNNIMFNVDNNASVTSLPTTTNFQWWVTVQDANGNSAQYTTTYATP